MHLADILMYLVSGEWYTAFWPKHSTLEDFEKVHVDLLLLFVPLRCQIQCKFIVRNLLVTFDRNIFKDGRHKMRPFYYSLQIYDKIVILSAVYFKVN